MKSIFRKLVLLLIALSRFFGSREIAKAAASPHKLASAEAKDLLKQAREQEARGNLKSAADTCLRSLALVKNKDAEGELRNIRKVTRAQAKLAFDRARGQYAGGNYSAALQSLLAAQQGVENSRAVAHNLAVTSYALKQTAETSAWLKAEIQLAAAADRPRLEAIQSGIIAPGLLGSNSAAAARTWNADLEKSQLNFRDAAKTESFSCDALNQWPIIGQSSPTFFYDLAQCDQYRGEFKSAAEHLDSYLRLAPDAVDHSAAERQLLFFRQLAALEGPQAQEAQRQMGTAFLLLQWQRILPARKAVECADAAVPNNSALQERLASLAEWSGDFPRATRFWRLAQEAERDPEAKARLQALADDSAVKEAQFRDSLSKARIILRDLLEHFVVDGEAPSYVYSSEQLTIADRDLGAAAAIAPFSPDLHLLYLFSVLQRNDMQSALRSMQILDAADVPVSFYGWVYMRPIQQEKDKDRGPRELAKIELDKQAFRLTDIGFCNLKKHKSTLAFGLPQSDSDRLRGFGQSAPTPGYQPALNLRRDQIKKIETRNEFVYVQIDGSGVKHRKLLIEPVQLASEVPLKGPGARRYANQYTSMLSDRLQFDEAKLGKESLTAGEKFEMVERFVNLAFEVYGAVGNPLGAYTAVRDAQKLTMYMNAMRAQTKTGRFTQSQTSLEYKLRALPVETLSLSFIEPDGSDALLKP